MKKNKKTLVAGVLGLCLASGTVGVYAGTVIESYKTPRGNIATVEPINVHKQRIGLTVNGKAVSKTTWYADGTTYVPMRDVAEILGASVNYNSATMSADIVTESKLLTLLGLKPQKIYYGTRGSNLEVEFKITQFNPSTNEFEGELNQSGFRTKIRGTLSENKMIFKYNYSTAYSDAHVATAELNYNGNENKYTGTLFFNDDATSDKFVIYIN